MRRLAIVPLLLVLASGAAACGSDGEREDVEAYIRDANAAQARFAPQLEQANTAYRKFAEGELDRVRADVDLTKAEQAIRDARSSLGRLRPPEPARPLHRGLLRIYEANADFASESTRLGRYLPAARATLKPLSTIGKRLQQRLEDADTPQAQSAAFAKYGRGVWGQYSRMRRLDPPPVLLPTHRAQLLRMTESVRLAEALSAATKGRDAKRVARLLLRFRAVNRRTGDAPLMRRAVRDYNTRYREVTATVTAVQQEQVRLQQRIVG